MMTRGVEDWVAVVDEDMADPSRLPAAPETSCQASNRLPLPRQSCPCLYCRVVQLVVFCGA